MANDAIQGAFTRLHENFRQLMLSPPEYGLHDLPQEVAEELTGTICDEDGVGDVLADTNADGWHLDDYQVIRTRFDFEAGELVGIHWHVQFHLVGDQKDDRMLLGDAGRGACVLLLTRNGLEIHVSKFAITGMGDGDAEDDAYVADDSDDSPCGNDEDWG